MSFLNRRFRNWLDSSSRRRRVPYRRLQLEPLEDRVLLASDFPDVISVGRTLSSWSVADIQDNQLKINYTVYNQQAEEVSGVLLTTTLEPGVSFADATVLPNRNGQELAWSLGTLAPFGRASVQLTVSFAGVVPLQVDDGAEAFGMVNAAAVNDAANPARLRTDTIDPALLAATPDANWEDPYIQAKAAELNQDANEIFQFLTQEIGYESYVGSLRGARGTMWSSAGNSLDEASLGIALLRASGVPARYAFGDLSDDRSRELTRSMFPNIDQAIGLIPAGANRADPVNDPRLLAEARSHFWVEFDAGVGFQAADGSFATAKLGETFATSAGTFAEVSAQLRHTITLTLDDELANPASGLLIGGSPLRRTTVLQHTFVTAELAGKPLSIGHFVNQQNFGTPIFTSITNTYSPYLVVGDEALPLGHTTLIRGADYQEVITNFPLGTQLLTALFLGIELHSPNGSTERHERTLVDRIGFDIRQNGGSPNLTFTVDTPPLISPLDVFTLYAVAGKSNPKASSTLPEELEAVLDSLRASPPDQLDPQDLVQIQVAQQGITRLFGDVLLRLSDLHTDRLGNGALVRAYFDQPRLVIVSAQLNSEESPEATLEYAIDLRRNDIRVLAYPGQATEAVRAFRTTWGLFENANEESIFSILPIAPAQPARSVGALRVLSEAAEQGIALVALGTSDRVLLETLDISAEARARIAALLAEPQTLIVAPTRAALIDGKPAIAWLQINLETGETIGVSEDGGHQGISEYSGLEAILAILDQATSQAKGALLAGAPSGVLAASYRLNSAAGDAASAANLVDLHKQAVIELVDSLPEKASIDSDTFERVFKELVKLQTGVDPPVPPVLVNPVPRLFPTANIAASQLKLPANSTTAGLRVSGSVGQLTTDQNTPVSFTLRVETDVAGDYLLRVEAPEGWRASLGSDGMVSVVPAPGLQGGTFPVRLFARSATNQDIAAYGEVEVTLGATVPGVSLEVVQDPLLYVPFNGAQLQTAYRVLIHNLGPSPETFELSVPSAPAGFEVRSSLKSVTVPAGDIAVVGLYLLPAAPLAPAGTPAPFSVAATCVSNNDLSMTTTVNFAIPAAHGITLTVAPAEVAALPGANAAVAIVVHAAGNQTENVNFDVKLSTGLTLGGLSNLVLLSGQSTTLNLTLTADAGVPLNTTLVATITAHFGAPDPVTVQIPLRVTLPGADAILRGSAAADALGATRLSHQMSDLGVTLANLVQSPTNAVHISQSLASLDSILTLLAVDAFFVAYVDPLAAARDQLAAATATADIQAAILALGAALDDFAVVVTNLARHNFTVDLFPDSGIAQPLLPVNYAIQVQNTGTEATTYNLDVSGLPASVSRQFSTTALTVAPGQIGEAVLTLTQTSDTELLTFAFNVNVSVASVTPEIRKSTIGTMQARREHVSVTDVIATPPFGAPGTNVAISAKILNAVNRRQDVRVSFVVRNLSGQQVFASTAVAATLTVQASVLNVALDSLDTTGFAEGQYTVAVSVTDLSGNPIPGGTGQTTLLVGSPISAALSVAPQTLPPGTSTVTNTLDITALVAPAEQLKLIGQFTEWLDRGSPRTVIAHDVVVRGNYAYVADDVINTVWNISDPTNPVHVPGLPFGNGGAYDFELADNGNFLVSMTQLSGGGAIRRISLAAPATPSVVSTSSFGYVLASDLLLRGNEAFATTNLVILQRNDITEQFGDLVALDWTVPFSPLHDVLFNTYGNTSDDDEDFGIPRNGGIHNMFGMAAPNASTLYVASTTSADTDVTKDEFGNPARGIIRIVDITDSKNLVQLGTLEIPGTMMVQQVVVDGNRAYVLGSQGAWRDPYTNPNDIGPVGNIVMAVLDISDPRNPTVMAPPTVLNRAARGHHGLTAIGGKRFVFGSLGTLSDTSQIFLIDASNPANLTVTRQITEPGVGGNMFVDDGHLYVATNVGVFIYSVGVADIPVKAQVQIPKGTGVEVVSGSFNVAPTQIINGTSFDTLVWDFTFDQTSAARTLTWQSTVSNLQPGESRPVTLGSTIDFTAQGTASQVTLPPREVFAGQVLALAPAARTVRPAEAAAYTLTVANPTASGVTYDLSVQGVPQAWVALPAQVFVPAGGSVNVSLKLTSDPFAPLTEFGFVVSAAVSGVSSSVQGALTLQGAAVLPPVQAEAHGVVVALTPTQAVAGQGTPTLYTVRLTNTGSITETFRLTTDLPAGFTATFGQTVVEVPPGASNFRDVTLTVVPALGTTAGDQPFVVTATSTTLAAVRDTASGTATVVASGVNVALSPASGPPNGPFQLTVTNTGQVRDTFDLSLVGPSALVASLDMSQVTLEPGAFKVVPITTSTVDFALPGPLNLMGVAQSITNPAVRVGAAAALSIPATTGLTAHFDPAARVLPLPGTSSFLLLVENTGNTEDSYTATITRTSGPVTANLSGLDGQPTQTIPVFRLPGLSTGAILVQTNLAAVGQGDVRVQVQSLSDPTRSSIATATVSAVAPPDTTPPTSSVAPLPAVSPTTFTVNWSGSDEVGGSGLATFDVFVSDNGGPFTPFLTGTTQTAAAFTGVAGHIYGFSSVATDNAGNRQPMPAAAQASTQVEVPPLPPPSDPPPPSGQRPASLRTTIGVVSPRGGFGQPPATWYLRNSNSPGTPDTAPFAYGFQDWVWLSGDWNGDRATTLGVFDPVGQFGQPPATWYLRDSNSQGVPDVAPFAYGGPNWIPVAGDWDGDGVTTIGVVEPTTMTWYLKNSNSPGAPDIAPFRYGHPGWIPVVGDWDGDGITTIGVYSPNGGFGQPAATWYLRNSNSPGAPDLAPFAYGSADWVPLAGDWDGDGSDSIGVFDPFGQFGQAAATWYLKNSNSPGAPDYGPFAYGAAGWRPVVGDWDGLDAFLRTDGAAFARRAVPAALTRSGSLDLTSVQQNETASAGAALARSPAVAPKPRHSPGSRERETPDEAPERQAATLDAGAQSLAALDAVFAQLGS